MSDKHNSAREVRKGEELNEANLQAFLFENELTQDKNSPLTVQQFSGGYSNLTYLLQTENKEYVLRRPPVGAIKRGHDMGREYKVLSKLHKVFKKCPQAYIYTENTEVIGSSFYVMERIDGIILRPKKVKALELLPQDFQKIATAWLDTLVELHSVDYKAAGLEDLGKPIGYVERQVTNWSKQYLKAKTEEIPSAIKVMEWIEVNQPKTYDFSLIHNDYKYDNVIFADTTWNEVRAILDWEMTTIGDPLMDLGMSLGYWMMKDDPDTMKMGMGFPTVHEGNPSRQEIAEQYAQKSGRNLSHLTFYYAFGLFKIAVIVQQIYARYEKGYTQDPRFAHLNIVCKNFCDAAWQAIQKDRV